MRVLLLDTDMAVDAAKASFDSTPPWRRTCVRPLRVSGLAIFARCANNQLTTGNPPYSIPPYSSRHAAMHHLRCGGGAALIAGVAAAGSTGESLQRFEAT